MSPLVRLHDAELAQRREDDPVDPNVGREARELDHRRPVFVELQYAATLACSVLVDWLHKLNKVVAGDAV